MQRLLIDVDAFLAQAAMRESHLAVIGVRMTSVFSSSTVAGSPISNRLHFDALGSARSASGQFFLATAPALYDPGR